MGHVWTEIVPIGACVWFPGSSSDYPDGWLVCNAQTVSRTTHKRLFDRIGTSYGVGDGSTTFNLPDLQATTPVGAWTGDTRWDNRGDAPGASDKTLSEANLASHDHGNGTLAVFGHDHEPHGMRQTTGNNSSLPMQTTTTGNLTSGTGMNTNEAPDVTGLTSAAGSGTSFDNNSWQLVGYWLIRAK